MVCQLSDHDGTGVHNGYGCGSLTTTYGGPGATMKWIGLDDVRYIRGGEP